LEDVTGFYRDILVDKPTETTVGSALGVQWYDLAQQQMNGMWQRGYAPGARVVYSNFAVGFVAALIEWATNQKFPDFTRQYIFKPLNMTNTAWFHRDVPRGVRQAMPVGLVKWRPTKWNDVGHYCFIDYASGSLMSSAADLAKFLGSMLDYGVPALWNDSSLGEQALSCLERNVQGNPVANCEFGANWILLGEKADAEEWLDPYRRYDWTDGAHHNGAEAGSQTQILLLPKAGVYAVVLTNTHGNDEYAPQWLASELLYEISS
jgi:CubicO group peptidase (beta-lactamase class C family)